MNDVEVLNVWALYKHLFDILSAAGKKNYGCKAYDRRGQELVNDRLLMAKNLRRTRILLLRTENSRRFSKFMRSYRQTKKGNSLGLESDFRINYNWKLPNCLRDSLESNRDQYDALLVSGAEIYLIDIALQPFKVAVVKTNDPNLRLFIASKPENYNIVQAMLTAIKIMEVVNSGEKSPDTYFSRVLFPEPLINMICDSDLGLVLVKKPKGEKIAVVGKAKSDIQMTIGPISDYARLPPNPDTETLVIKHPLMIWEAWGKIEIPSTVAMIGRSGWKRKASF